MARLRGKHAVAAASLSVTLLIALGACTSSGGVSNSPSSAVGPPPTASSPSGASSAATHSSALEAKRGDTPRVTAYRKLLKKAKVFAVSGAVKTHEGLLLPETIAIHLNSEICVESRAPGSRFWSLDDDTCFVFSAVDTVDSSGKYALEIPCLDADKTYEARHAFGDIRLVQQGPVDFEAVSDAGWHHQETFASSRFVHRDLVLTLTPDTFWVIEETAPLRTRPRTDASTILMLKFGEPLDVVRFHKGWAEAIRGRRIGWVELQAMGTEEDVEKKRPFRGKPEARPLRNSP